MFVVFCNVIIPQYILHFVPFNSGEYLLTSFVLSCYFNQIGLFNKLYVFIYHYPNKLLAYLFFKDKKKILRDDPTYITDTRITKITKNKTITKITKMELIID